MYNFPFIEAIEKILNWAKHFGSPLYWIWIAVPSLIGGVAFSRILDGASWSDTKFLWILTALVFVLPLPLIFWHENQWNKQRKNNDRGD